MTPTIDTDVSGSLRQRRSVESYCHLLTGRRISEEEQLHTVSRLGRKVFCFSSFHFLISLFSFLAGHKMLGEPARDQRGLNVICYRSGFKEEEVRGASKEGANASAGGGETEVKEEQRVGSFEAAFMRRRAASSARLEDKSQRLKMFNMISGRGL